MEGRQDRFARRVARRLHVAASADGAGDSGLAALLGTHALNAAGDALVAVSLASTAFFAVSAFFVWRSFYGMQIRGAQEA